MQRLEDVVPLKPSVAHKKVPWSDNKVKKAYLWNKYYQHWLKKAKPENREVYQKRNDAASKLRKAKRKFYDFDIKQKPFH